ncbi:MAG: pyridine nucleotide-disulfide oxidoreductase [Deltaproteobacteria bacterium]|nr:pyridine nucleotide-disulfide oxidoreductase [Deltaproteobacteria bacterium]
MSQHIIIIGAVALGPKAACRLKRLQPSARVTMVDRASVISYGGCGIPYLISGDVPDPSQLQRTAFHAVRDPEFFRTAKGVDVLTETDCLAIDRANKAVTLKPKNGEPYVLNYDQLVLGTGSRPIPMPLPGRELPGCFTVHSMEAATEIHTLVTAGGINRAIIVGAGCIGLEMAEALSDMWGIETSVIELSDQVLPGIISGDMSRMVEHHLIKKDIDLFLSERVTAIEGENGSVARVVTENRTLDADLVILAVGVVPNGELARQAGLAVSGRGAIIVDKTMRTSDPNIFAGGDSVCVENLVTGTRDSFALGSLANRQGRVIGSNLAGGRETFPGAVGTLALKIFDHAVAGAGLSIDAARRHGFNAFSAQVIQFDHAHFYPDKTLMALELVVEEKTGRVLGIQGMSENGEGLLARINAVAAILPNKPVVQDICCLELAYSPPFSAAMDVLNNLGNVAENILNGRNRVIGQSEFQRLWADREEGRCFFLDCRDPENVASIRTSHPEHWNNIPAEILQDHTDELPRDKTLVLVCNTGARSYEAQRKLDAVGLTASLSLQGGMGMLNRWGLNLADQE